MPIDSVPRITLTDPWVSPSVVGIDPAEWYYIWPNRRGYSFVVAWEHATDPYGVPVPKPAVGSGWVWVSGTGLRLYWQEPAPSAWDPEGRQIGGWTQIGGGPKWFGFNIAPFIVTYSAVNIEYTMRGEIPPLGPNEVGTASLGKSGAGWDSGDAPLEMVYSAPQFTDGFIFRLHYSVDATQPYGVPIPYPWNFTGPVNLGGSMQVARDLTWPPERQGLLNVKLNNNAGASDVRYGRITGGPDGNDTGLLRVKTALPVTWHTADDRTRGSGILWVKTMPGTGMETWGWGSWMQSVGDTPGYRMVEVTPTWVDSWPIGEGNRLVAIPRNPDEFVQPPDFMAYFSSPSGAADALMSPDDDGSYVVFAGTAPHTEPYPAPPPDPRIMYWSPDAYLTFQPPAEPVDPEWELVAAEVLYRARGWPDPLEPIGDGTDFVFLHDMSAPELPLVQWPNWYPPEWIDDELQNVSDSMLMTRNWWYGWSVFAPIGQWVTLRSRARPNLPTNDQVNNGSIHMRIEGPRSSTFHLSGVVLRLLYRTG